MSPASRCSSKRRPRAGFGRWASARPSCSAFDDIHPPRRERDRAGRLLLAYRYEANLLGGAVIILFGALMIGFVGLPWLERDLRFHLAMPGGRPLAGYALGAAFAFGWTPCIGPVLGAILTTSAIAPTVPQGVLLLTLFSAGLAIPFS